MTIATQDWEKKFLAAWTEENTAYRAALDADDALVTMQRKARLYDILSAASKREIEAIWDAANATGCPIEPMIEALGRRIA